uniref:Uncharacterized protein n=1 Tax=Arundo donax TaxID=35708 RepID=A0A0A8ZZA1_ARUDO
MCKDCHALLHQSHWLSPKW